MTVDRELDALARAFVAVAGRSGLVIDVGQAQDFFVEAGLLDVLEDLSVARAVVRAADGFHPVARFFVEGSLEREFIDRTLHGAPEGSGP